MPHNQPIRFISSFLFGGSLFVRDVIEIDGVFITLRQKGVFNDQKKSVNIPLSNVKNIGIRNTLTGTNIFIESLANRSFTGHGFSAKAAKKITKAIEVFNNRSKENSNI
ncbi:MAG: hypothetical protein RBS07_01920 [Lentimicrobium sp.]|jgi:hypothetical protein|nr:hypothetical protein [Lentimicrobium sp.]